MRKYWTSLSTTLKRWPELQMALIFVMQPLKLSGCQGKVEIPFLRGNRKDRRQEHSYQVPSYGVEDRSCKEQGLSGQHTGPQGPRCFPPR